MVGVFDVYRYFRTEPFPCFDKKPFFLARRVIRGTFDDPEKGLARLGLNDLRFKDMNEVFKNMIQPPNSDPIRQNQVIFLPSINGIYQTPWSAARALVAEYNCDIARIVPNQGKAGFVQFVPTIWHALFDSEIGMNSTREKSSSTWRRPHPHSDRFATPSACP